MGPRHGLFETVRSFRQLSQTHPDDSSFFSKRVRRKGFPFLFFFLSVCSLKGGLPLSRRVFFLGEGGGGARFPFFLGLSSGGESDLNKFSLPATFFSPLFFSTSPGDLRLPTRSNPPFFSWELSDGDLAPLAEHPFPPLLFPLPLGVEEKRFRLFVFPFLQAIRSPSFFFFFKLPDSRSDLLFSDWPTAEAGQGLPPDFFFVSGPAPGSIGRSSMLASSEGFSLPFLDLGWVGKCPVQPGLPFPRGAVICQAPSPLPRLCIRVSLEAVTPRRPGSPLRLLFSPPRSSGWIALLFLSFFPSCATIFIAAEGAFWRVL